MGLFDFINKKKKQILDPTQIKITDLELGWVFDYNLETWEIKEVYEYDWGDSCFSYEYKIDNGKEILFLYIEEDDTLTLSISKKLKLTEINPTLSEEIQKNEKPPATITFGGTTYIWEEETPGYFRNITKNPDNKIELITWDYLDKEQKNTLSIEQWNETRFNASVGKIIHEYEINNILPVINK